MVHGKCYNYIVCMACKPLYPWKEGGSIHSCNVLCMIDRPVAPMKWQNACKLYTCL